MGLGTCSHGVTERLPRLDSWLNQFPGYRIVMSFREQRSVCPTAGLPDYGTIIIEYELTKSYLEVGAPKMYLLACRDRGYFTKAR